MFFRHAFLEKFGYYGAAAVIGGYFLVSFSVISADSIWYQLLNLTGALGLLLDSRYHKAKPSVVINSIWTLIAFVAIVNILF